MTLKVYKYEIMYIVGIGTYIAKHAVNSNYKF